MRDRLFVVFVFGLAIIMADFSLVAADVPSPGAPTEVVINPGGLPNPTTTNALVEVPSPIVVEEADHFVLESRGASEPSGVLDADHGPSTETQEAMERHARQIKAIAAARAGVQGNLPTNGYAAANGGVAVAYNASYPAPSSVKTVVNAAVAEWDDVLATNPSGPIVIEVFWSDLGNPSLLGYAGPDGMYHGGSLPTSSLYPAALTNTLLGLDANGSSRAEVQVVLNSQLLSNNRWYLGTTGTPAGGQIDLFSVVLHEVGHGLGFLGSATVPNGSSTPELHDPPYVFDNAAHWNGTPVHEAADQAAALLSGDVHIQISTDATYELYAPSSWSQGSSFSHFDESAYPSGSPGALMTPMLSSGEVARQLDAPTLGLLARTGWPLTVAATTPDITNVSASLTAAIVSWEPDYVSVGVLPNTYVIEAWRDGSVLQSSVTVSGATGTATVGSLSPGQAYTIKVVPVGPNGFGVPAEAALQLPSSGGPVDPSEWPTYIRDLPLDGQINRLYQAYFLRLADQSGFDYWLGQRAAWTSLEDISAAFAGSPEFQAQYGSLTDEAFVDLVYANVLNRVADAEGRAYWVSQLSLGTPRGVVMIGFAESAEYVVRTGTATPTGSDQAKINRLYNAFFLRSPDDSGLSYWAGQLGSGVSLETVATAFAESGEFQTQYGALTDEAFVNLIYTNVLGRSADADGLSYWVGQLQAGVDRGTVMIGFSESTEFIVSTGTIP